MPEVSLYEEGAVNVGRHPLMTRGDAGVALSDIVRMLWREATPLVKRRLSGALALVVSAAMASALAPVALRYIVDQLSGKRTGRLASLPVLVALYVLALWFARTANELRELAFAHANQRIVTTLSERLFWHLMHLPLRFHLDRQTGAVSQTLDNGLEGLRVILRHLVFTCLPVTVESVAIVLVLVRAVPRPLLALFCAALICYVGAFGYSAKTVTQAVRGASAARVAANAAMTDVLLNYETVKYFTAELLVQERIAVVLRRCELEWVGFYRRYALNGVAVAAILGAFLAGAVLCAMEDVKRGRMTLGDFVLVNTYILQVVQPIEMMGYAMQGLSQGVAMLDKLVQLLREPTEPRLPIASGHTAEPASLTFHDVCLSYSCGRPVLRKVSFRIQAGRSLAIVGPSGSGKSTIVRLLMRLLEPEGGLILLDDKPISVIALQDLRRAIAVVPQDTVLFDGSVGYNIAFGRADASREEVERAAKIAQLHDFIMSLPDQYEARVGERGMKLSGGERQRVSIARAVLKPARIYVFDEATSALDSVTERQILGTLRAISTGNTTIVIAHRLSSAVHADEILVLDNGEVAEQGTHGALLRGNGTYAALWRAQQAQWPHGR